jgi:hypothetical protein
MPGIISNGVSGVVATATVTVTALIATLAAISSKRSGPSKR